MRRRCLPAFSVILLLFTFPPGLLAPASAAAPFPDVPPWHWAHDSVQFDQAAGLVVGYPASPAELAANAVRQVYEGFAHAGSPGAQEWIERFTFNRPPGWPAPLTRAQLLRVALSGMAVVVRQDASTATFTAAVTMRDGRSTTAPMRVGMRFNGQDWQVDYADLAAASPMFR